MYALHDLLGHRSKTDFPVSVPQENRLLRLDVKRANLILERFPHVEIAVRPCHQVRVLEIRHGLHVGADLDFQLVRLLVRGRRRVFNVGAVLAGEEAGDGRCLGRPFY